MRHLLIFVPDGRGHPFEWLQHLLTFRAAERPDLALSLVLPRALAAALRTWRPPEANALLALHEMAAAEEAGCTDRRLVRSGFSRWRTICGHLQRTGAEHGFCLDLDHLALPLALGLRAPAPVSGILFRPSVHYRRLGGYRPRLRERLRDVRKDRLYGPMLRNPSLRTALSLDPYFVPFAGERYSHGRKVKPLVDPVPPAPEPTAADWALARRLPADRRKFVLFGVLSERKGILRLLEALARIEADVAGRVAVIAAGQVDPPVREQANAALHRVRRERADLFLHLEDRHLSAGEIEALVRSADIVLAPYQRFVGSSGVMLWAARCGRPVLVQDFGLLGHLTRAFGLGVAVDTSDATALSAAIARIAREPRIGSLADPEGMACFAATRRPDHFARQVFAGVCEEFGASSAMESSVESLIAAPN